MGWARYLLAIVVGLAAGMAIGWYSGRVDAGPPQAAGRHHHRHHHDRSRAVNVPSQQHRPDRSRPAPEPTPPAHVPTMRELEQQTLQCVLEHPYAAGRVACLRAVLRQLGATPGLWGGPGGGGQSLPFALPGQD